MPAESIRELQQNALRLLHRLEQERAEYEEINEEQGKLDPIKEIRGVSAMDDAIREARNLVARLDQLSDQAHPRPTDSTPEVVIMPRQQSATQNTPAPTSTATATS